MKQISLVFALLAGLSSTALAETLYVQSLKAKLLAEPAFKARVVASVNKGAALNVLQYKGRWCQVSSGEHSGWVSRFVLADHPPLNKITVLGGEREIEQNARRRASAVTTAGAARGLSAEQRRRGQVQGANYPALEKVEAIAISDEEAFRFLQEGLKP